MRAAFAPSTSAVPGVLALGASLTFGCATPRSLDTPLIADTEAPPDVAHAHSGATQTRNAPVGRGTRSVPESSTGETRSPQPSRAHGFALELEHRCGRGDHTLALAAGALARMQLERDQDIEPSSVVDALRAAGAPYVWPRAWTRTASVGERNDTVLRMSEWLASFDDGGERRCGIVIEPLGREELVAAIAVDTLADLRPLPRRARLATWLDVEAEMLVANAGAKVVVLGPRGLPRSLPTNASAERVRARFNADQPGAWLVQVLADVDGGPRPVLEARVFVGVDPHTNSEASAPGEAQVPPDADPVLALEALLAAARRAEGLPNLRRDPRLDRAAQEHAERMKEARRVAHDVGDGDPSARVGQAGLSVAIAGENVARAPNAIRAQRALWASPSHRANSLSPHFDIVGIGVARDGEGSLWVCELFARLTDE